MLSYRECNGEPRASGTQATSPARPGHASLAEFTAPELVLPSLVQCDAAALISQLCAALQREGAVENTSELFRAVLARESLASTASSPGWALPHVRLGRLDRIRFALGRCASGIRWFGGEPVQLVFLFVVPDAGAPAYLRVVSALARLSQDPVRSQRLLEAPDSRSLYALLEETHFQV